MPDQIEWNFKLLAHHELQGFGGMGEGMSIQIAKDGRRIIWLAHESAPKNFTAVDVSDPRKPKVVVQTELPQSLHALELARGRRRHHGGRLPVPEAGAEARRLRAVRHLGAGEAEVDRVRRPLGREVARRAPALVLRRRIRAHGLGRGGFRHAQPARRPVLPDLRRAQSVGAEGGRALVDAGHARRRHRSRRPRATSRRSSTWASARTTPTSIRSGPDRCYLGYIDAGMYVLDISDKANPKPIVPLGQLAALSRLHPHGAAAVRARPVRRHRRVGGGRRGRLAEAGVDPRRARRDQSGADRDLPASPYEASRTRAAASARTTSTRTCRCRRRGIPTRSSSARSSTAACAPTTSPIRTSRRKSAPSCPRRRRLAPRGTIQLNDVFVDERGIVYTVDRHVGGLYVLEMDF